MIALRLPLAFDPARLAADLAAIREDEWVFHFNKPYYEGEWSGVSLRSIGGETGTLYPDPTRSDYADTEVLERTPYFREVLSEFQCPLLAVRLLRLSAGSRIREHRDYKLSIEDGEFRVHIPVQTNPDLVFMLGGERVVMREGTMWYLNVNHPHSVYNGGAAARVHLVVDCVVNEWVTRMVASATVDQFFASVAPGDPLEERLRALTDKGEFAAAVAEASSERGLALTADQVVAAMAERRGMWARRML